jgi:hypothetical protein
MFVACSYPWTRLLLPPQRAVFQESTTSIHVSMDTFVDCSFTRKRFLETAYMSQYYQPIGRRDPGKPRRRWLHVRGRNGLRSPSLIDDDDDIYRMQLNM